MYSTAAENGYRNDIASCIGSGGGIVVSCNLCNNTIAHLIVLY